MATDVKPMTPLRYLMNVLGIKAADWSPLDTETKEWYKNAAIAEMNAVGQPIQGGK